MKKGMRKLIAIASIVTTLCGMTGGGLIACGDPDKESNKPGGTTEKQDVYTLNSIFSLTPTKWSPHTWETDDDNTILQYTTMGFYDVQLNADGTGYEWVSEMASDFPKDVTSQYVGKYGIESDDERKVWEIPLNKNAKWDDGTPIKADDYVYSLKQLLDPDMLNRRSDSYTGGGFTIYGAKDYLYSHTMYTYETVASQGYKTNAEAIAANAEFFVDVAYLWGAKGSPKVTATSPLTIDYGTKIDKWLAYKDATTYFDINAFAADNKSYMNADGTVNTTKIADDGLDVSKYLFNAKTVYDAYGAALEVGTSGAKYVSIRVENTNTDASFDNVGIEKKDDYTIVVAVTDEQDDFYVKYYLSSNWLVKKDLYEACKVKTGNLVSSRYCTSKETTPSYGPYKLTSFTHDSEFKLVFNPEWYGYNDGKHEGQFQTTSMNYRYLSSASAHETAKTMFFKGQVDDLELSSDAEYTTFSSTSCYNVYPESFTMQFFMTTNEQYLESESTATENHRPLSLATFRKALSYSFDRTAYCNAYYPASQPGFGILNYMYSIDGNTGELYREQDAAKKASLRYSEFTENQDGSWTSRNGVEFDTLDDAYEAITGYDPAYAAELFERAYAEAKAKGIYKDGEKVVLELRSAGDKPSAMFTGTIAMFNEDIKDALALCKNPTFASVELKVGTSTSEDEYNAELSAGRIDISYSGWGGAAFNPWGVIYGSYIDPANSHNYGFDSLSKTIDITIKYNNRDVTASLYDWSCWLDNHQEDRDYDTVNLFKTLGIRVGEADIDFRVEVLAECELAQLNTAVNIPLYYQSVGALNSAKYKNGCDAYLPLIGFGGIRHITFNYTNSQWSAWVAKQGGDLEQYYKTH